MINIISGLVEVDATLVKFLSMVTENSKVERAFFELKARLFIRPRNKEGLLVLTIDPHIKGLYWLGLIVWFVGVLFANNVLILTGGFMYFILLFFYSSYFYMLTLRAGLRKAGYRKKIKFVKPGVALAWVVTHGTAGNFKFLKGFKDKGKP